MSIFRQGKSPIYRYDFTIKGERFHGTTECRTKAEARNVEARIKADAKDIIKARRRRASDPMTLDLAAGRFWTERGQFYRGNARATFKASLAWIVRTAGPDRSLLAITNRVVADLVARRRGESVSNATVNRTVTEPLRRIMLRARDAWDQDIPKIKWGNHLLPEPKERVRELSEDEEERIFAALCHDYALVVRFALQSGCRLGECVGLRWSDVDWGARELRISGKGGKVAKIPLTNEMRELLWPLQPHHTEAVFTYATKAGRSRITYEGMKTAWRRAVARAGVMDFRFHDNRHTAATRLLRSGANIKMVQQLLRHEDIATTARYAHVTMDDLREAMEKSQASSQKRGVSR